MRIWTGRCLCGQASYEVRAEPVYAGFCHCRDCQRATSTGHSCYIGFARDAVTLSGETRAFPVRADSGALSFRHFCPDCGTHLFGRREPDDGHFTVYAGTLDEPERFVPRESIFVRSRRDWDVSGLDLPAYPALP